MHLRRLCFLVCLASCLTCVSVFAQPTRLTAEVPAGLAEEMRHALRAELLDVWYPRAVDRRHGGFLSRFDAAWQPEGSQEKMIVTQARHVWTTARAAL
jgi:mannobiose 2-epimerase